MRTATGPARPRDAPRYWTADPKPIPLESPWPSPPVIDTVTTTGSLLPSASAPPRYNVELIDTLNGEYRDRPVVPAARKVDPASRIEQARRRMELVHNRIGLTGQRVLEVGCGDGFETWSLAHRFDADVVGVDIVSRSSWLQLSDRHTRFRLVDIGAGSLFGEGSFDRVISFSVWEHMAQPVEALQEVFRVSVGQPPGFAAANGVLPSKRGRGARHRAHRGPAVRAVPDAAEGHHRAAHPD
jgi:SAM-dependent methyltransferase